MINEKCPQCKGKGECWSDTFGCSGTCSKCHGSGVIPHLETLDVINEFLDVISGNKTKKSD